MSLESSREESIPFLREEHHLFIDTSQEASYIALFGGIKSHIEIAAKEQTKQLLPQIDALLKKHALSLDQITSIGVSIGPGSYTGTRVGLITAKGIAFAKKIPLITLDSFIPYALVDHATCLLAKRGFAYLKEGETYHYLTLNELEKKGLLIAAKAPLTPIEATITTYDLDKIEKAHLQKWANRIFDDPKELEALYLDPL